MRILIISPTAPYPPAGGWQVVIYNDARYLAARGHTIHLLALSRDRAKSPRDLADVAHAEYFYSPIPPRWWQVLRNLGHEAPFAVERKSRRGVGLLRRAVELVRQGAVDVVLIEDAVMAWCAEPIRRAVPVPTFLRDHNVSTTVMQRYYQDARNPLLRFLGYRQYRKFARYEARVWELVDGVSQISPVDAEEAQRLNPRVSQRVIMSGVDLDYFRPGPFEQRDPRMLVHVGRLDPITKLPGMIWFCERVLPRVRARLPDVRLELVGEIPPGALKHVDPRQIVIHGHVPDVRPYLARAGVFISPQFIGSGIRVKLLTAMAGGSAVVSTSVGCEGLPVTHGEHMLIADEEESFADCVCELLSEPERRRRIGQAARTLVERHFSWETIAAQLEAALHEAIAAGRTRCA